MLPNHRDAKGQYRLLVYLSTVWVGGGHLHKMLAQPQFTRPHRVIAPLPSSSAAGTSLPSLQSEEILGACRALFSCLMGNPKSQVALARRWLYRWLEHDESISNSTGQTGAPVIADLLYNVLLSPVEIELSAYQSGTDGGKSITLQVLGPLTHSAPRVFSTVVDRFSDQRLGLVCLQLINQYRRYFGEAAARAGLSRGMTFRSCALDRPGEDLFDRITMCRIMIQLFLLGGISQNRFTEAIETTCCAVRYLREMLEARSSVTPTMRLALDLCLEVERQSGPRQEQNMLLWLSEFIASYSYGMGGDPAPTPPEDEESDSTDKDEE